MIALSRHNEQINIILQHLYYLLILINLYACNIVDVVSQCIVTLLIEKCLFDSTIILYLNDITAVREINSREGSGGTYVSNSPSSITVDIQYNLPFYKAKQNEYNKTSLGARPPL